MATLATGPWQLWTILSQPCDLPWRPVATFEDASGQLPAFRNCALEVTVNMLERMVDDGGPKASCEVTYNKNALLFVECLFQP